MRRILLLLVVLCCPAGAMLLQAQSPAHLWHGMQRQLRYRPVGTDFVISNGTHRFNRALYGTHTAFRVEAGDLPEFALYLPGMGGNLKLGLVKGKQSQWLAGAQHIEARYRPGTLIYHIKDPLLGNATLTLQILAGADDENLILKAHCTGAPQGIQLLWAFGGATGKKFSRDGDIGADPESVFYLHPEYCRNNNISLQSQNHFALSFLKTSKNKDTIQQTLYGLYPAGNIRIADAQEQKSPAALWASTGSSATPLVAGKCSLGSQPLYWVIQNGKTLQGANAATLFTKAEAARSTLAARVVVHTPDAYINTLGGALAMAADGIWESPSYMHGAVAWRQRLPAWRGPYVADPLGWHNRAWLHFSSYAQSQVLEPASGPVVADTALHLARQLERMGTSMFSRGYISRNPGGDLRPHHYDMNLVYIDELLNHFKWTGNLAELRQLWPVIQRSLAWEKRNYDADGDGLYDAYCAIWASDALQYSGGGVAHTSAYNYRANLAAAQLATLLGENPAPYRVEAAKIRNAINGNLWLRPGGNYAEYKDLLGLQLVHPAAGLWTVYHLVDAGAADAFQTYQALRYVDNQLPHIPVVALGLNGHYKLLATTRWLPYDWSLNNVVMAENLHAALAYWQGGRATEAFNLWKSALLESMYLGSSPGNFQQISFYDAHRGELYRDFADPIGMAARSLVEGLFGINPDLLHDTVLIKPGLPAEWNQASLQIPDITFSFKRQGLRDTYSIDPRFAHSANLILQVPVCHAGIAAVLINNRPAHWVVQSAVGKPVLKITAGKSSHCTINIVWQGAALHTQLPAIQAVRQTTFSYHPVQGRVIQVNDPQQVLERPRVANGRLSGMVSAASGAHTLFAKIQLGNLNWWQPINLNIFNPIELSAPTQQTANQLNFRLNNHSTSGNFTLIVNGHRAHPYRQQLAMQHGQSLAINVPTSALVPGSNRIQVQSSTYQLDTLLVNWHIPPVLTVKAEPVTLATYFNDEVNHIFTNKYLTPRPKSATLQLPWQGIGNWAYPLVTANIDDSGLRREAARNQGRIATPLGISFATPLATGTKNIIFTSRWDNYPHSAAIKLSGKATHAYFLLAGSTNAMQSRMVNGTLTVTYKDGTTEVLQLKNPENWWPIEQDDDMDNFAFNTNGPHPLRLVLKTGQVTDNYSNYTSIKGYSNRVIDGGAATILDLPLNPAKELKQLELRTITNEVVIGLMALTLIRP